MKIRAFIVYFVFLISIIMTDAFFIPAFAVDSAALEHAQRGWTLYERGEYDKAIVEYKKAIEIDNDYADAHYTLGYIYHLQAAHKNEVAPRKLNTDFPVQTYKSKWEYGLEELDLAMREFKEVIRIEPNAADAHFKLGVVYDNKGEHESAISEYRKTIELDPEGPDGLDARGNLALIYYTVYEKKDEAIRMLEELLKIDPNHPARGNLEKIQQGTW